MESMHLEASCTRDVETYSDRHLKGLISKLTQCGGGVKIVDLTQVCTVG